MNVGIKGFKYIFNVILQEGQQDHFFAIQALDSSSHRASYINNLNVILSEFDIETNNSRVENSTWLIGREEAKQYVDIAVSILTDQIFLSYLEKRLDEDRTQGEWENFA